jgi:hypothetical protein
MHRLTLLTGFLAGLLAATFVALLPNAPARAATPKQKAATCKFYADQQKLAGPKRAQFMAKCTSNKNDPRGGAAGASGGPPGSVPAPDEPEGGQPELF